MHRRTNQLLEHTTVQIHLRLSAFPHVVVVVFEAFPVGSELLQAVGIDILDPTPKSASSLLCISLSEVTSVYIHTCGAAGDFAALLETFNLSSAIGLLFALHVIVIISLAAVSNEVGCAH